jgi:hypothetical protein
MIVGVCIDWQSHCGHWKLDSQSSPFLPSFSPSSGFNSVLPTSATRWIQDLAINSGRPHTGTSRCCLQFIYSVYSYPNMGLSFMCWCFKGPPHKKCFELLPLNDRLGPSYVMHRTPILSKFSHIMFTSVWNKDKMFSIKFFCELFRGKFCENTSILEVLRIWNLSKIHTQQNMDSDSATVLQ